MNTGINYQPQLVQDFFHQQYHREMEKNETLPQDLKNDTPGPNILRWLAPPVANASGILHLPIQGLQILSWVNITHNVFQRCRSPRKGCKKTKTKKKDLESHMPWSTYSDFNICQLQWNRWDTHCLHLPVHLRERFDWGPKHWLPCHSSAAESWDLCMLSVW